MNEDNLQLDQPDLSDDDLAAALGFITTLSEAGMEPDSEEPTDMQEAEPMEQETKEPEDKAEEEHEQTQDEEIAKIKAELEKLLNEEHDKETEDTGTADKAE